MATTVIEPSTQQPVDLTGLSPEERLYCAFLEHCDPETIDLADGLKCLCGQVGAAYPESGYVLEYGDGLKACNISGLADYFGVSRETLDDIYFFAGVCEDLDAALAMARRVLGLDEHGRKRS